MMPERRKVRSRQEIKVIEENKECFGCKTHGETCIICQLEGINKGAKESDVNKNDMHLDISSDEDIFVADDKFD